MLATRIATSSALRGVLSRARHAKAMSSRSTMHENDPEALEREKARNVSGEQHKTPHIDSVPGWNEKPASSSEAHVKADRHPHEGSVKDLQNETAKKHKRAHEGNA